MRSLTSLFQSPPARHLYAAITGITLVYYPFGFGCNHSLAPSLLTYLAILLIPSKCGYLSWLLCFPYLIYLHVASASGENWRLGLLDFTACEMTLVLKLISLAVARQDGWMARKKGVDLSPYQAEHAVDKAPSLLQYLSYVYGLGNLLSGPYLEFVSYRDFVELKGLWSPKNPKKIPFLSPLKSSLVSLIYACTFLALHQALIPIWNERLFDTPWYQDQGYHIRILCTFVISFTTQTKFVFAWKLSEASLSLAGLGFEGWDEKTGLEKWGRCENVRFFTMLASDSARVVVSHWNILTGVWLRRYVYERLTPKGKKPGFAQLMATQLVSAIWHGLYPGYLLFFAGSAFWMNFATVIFKAEQALLPSKLHSFLPWHLIKCIWTHLCLNYLAVCFTLLELQPCLRAWASIRYIPVIVIVGGSVLASVVPSGRSSKTKKAN